MQRDRITPAYAGKSSNPHSPDGNPEDHPRLRGEKQSKFIQFLRSKGSPPLTRGKVARKNSIVSADRITPAYAGKSPVAFMHKKSYKDHPRLRGEKSFRKLQTEKLQGSPPLTRGKGKSISSHRSAARITPAYAGKRPRKRRRRRSY